MKFFSRLFEKIRYAVRYISFLVKKVTRFVTVDIWDFNEENITKWKGRLVKDLKTILVMLNTFSSQKIGFQSTALCYQSTMAVVPFLAIAFYLTGGLGLSGILDDFLHANISDERLLNVLLNAADNILTTAQSGLFGFVSMLTFVWIVIWLMISVRRVFNNVWKVEKEQKFWKMIAVVFGIIILTPFILLLFFSGSIVYTNVLDLVVPSKVEFSESLRSVLGWIIFAVVAILIISAMYKFIPGCHVHYRHAFRAAVFSGLIFTGLQYLYLETQVMVSKQSAVYGVVAALPLFMIWLNLGWTVILYGAELSYAMQEVDRTSMTSEQLDAFRKMSKKQKKQYTEASVLMEEAENQDIKDEH